MTLTAGERITLIKRVAEALDNERSVDMNLVLGEFGVPYLSDFDESESKYEYAMARLRNADDKSLVGLNAHLYPDVTLAHSATGVVGPWWAGYFRLFLSHTNANKQLAGEIRTYLLDFGVDAFVAHDIIEPTKEWMDEIETALGTADALAAILTEDFLASKWCDQEVGFAVGRGVLIVPIRQGADPHGFIGKYQALPGDASSLAAHTIATGIYNTLMVHAMTKAKMSQAIAHRYANSTSFDDARVNLSRLKAIPKEHWAHEMVEKVEDAGKENTNLVYGESSGRKIPDIVSSHLNQLLGRESTVSVPDFRIATSDDDIPF